jgi:septum site-determining protein MinC
MDRTAGTNDSGAAFELKGGVFAIPVLSLQSMDMDATAAQLAEKVNQAADFFHNAPVVINLKQLELEEEPLDLVMLVNLMRNQGLIPIGITGGTETQHKQAAALELAVLAARSGGGRIRPEESRSQVENLAAQEPEEQLVVPFAAEQPRSTEEPRFISDPVRSGQSVVINQGDMIVLASVGSGAELAAPGSIHVYGALRGRAFAGSGGDVHARIFCQKLEAELVAIAGVHLVSEDFPDHLRSKAVQIRLHGGKLHIIGL